MAKKEIDWKHYATLDVLCLYDLIHLSLGIHPEEPLKKLSPELDLKWTNRNLMCLGAIKTKELKNHTHIKGIDIFSPPAKAYHVLIDDFVRFALKWKWKLPDEFPRKNQVFENEYEACPFCHYKTNLIKIQGEAIKKFWADFDFTKPETEPKSAVIIDWIMTEHGVSDRIASAIATIIRPDRLNRGIKKQKKPLTD